MRFCTFLGLISIVGSSQAGVLRADGSLRVKGGQVDGIRCTLVSATGQSRSIASSRGRLLLELSLQTTALFIVEKEGCATKSILFDTRMPGQWTAYDWEFPFQVTLERFATEDSFAYNKPVGEVHFSESLGDFTYSTEYDRTYPAALLTYIDKSQEEASTATPLTSTVSGSLAVHGPAQPTEGGVPVAPTTVREAARVERMEPLAPHRIEAPALTRSRLASMPPASTLGALRVQEPVVHEPVATEAPKPCECGTTERTGTDRYIIDVHRLPEEGHCVEWRKVVHAWGGIFYFKDGRSIPAWMYARAID